MRSIKVFVIHMLGILIISLIFGIFVATSAMWIFGSVSTFFMIGFHLPHIVKDLNNHIKN